MEVSLFSRGDDDSHFSETFNDTKMPIHDGIQATLTVIVISVKGVCSFLCRCCLWMILAALIQRKSWMPQTRSLIGILWANFKNITQKRKNG